MSLHDAVAGYIETVSSGHYDMPRRKVAEDLRALLAQYHPAADPTPAEPEHAPATAGDPGAAGASEYAILSFRDGLEPVDSLEEANEQMTMIWRKPGRARIMHRRAWATDWAPLEPDAAGPELAAA
jgi:hypothetical protein